MKKIFTIAMIAFAAIAFTGCQKQGNGNNGDDQKFKPTARMLTMTAVYGEDTETWAYSYNKDGKVAEIKADWCGEVYSDYKFNYSGNKCEVKDGDKKVFDIELNDKGLATKVTAYDKETTVYELAYTPDGFLASAKVNGKEATKQEINGEECVEYWTRWNGDTNAWRQKQHTYDLKKENVGAVHTEWAEDAGLKRWFYESGLVGRASRFVCATAQWADRTARAEYQYEFDATGAIKTETKNYGEPGALEFDCKFTFTWQAIN